MSNTANPHGVTAEQVGARPNTWMPTAADVGAMPIIDARSASYNMDTILESKSHQGFYLTNDKTLGTPYAKRVSAYVTSLIISYAGYTDVDNGVQMAFMNGNPTVYIRYRYDGTTSDWKKLYTEHNMTPYSLNQAENIPNESDLNDYTTFGNYYVSSNQTSTLKNVPTSLGSNGFVLRVERCTYSITNYCKQRIVSYNSGAEYWRVNKNGTWTDWIAIAQVTAGTGLSSSFTNGTVTISLPNSGVTAGTYGPSADVSGTNNTTMNVPEIEVDNQGRITKITNRVYTAKNNTYTVNNKTVTLTAGKGLTEGGSFTANQSSDKTITFNVGAGTGISVTADAVGHSNSVTAATVGSTDNYTASWSNGFAVPWVTYDSEGHVTASGTRTITMPANPNSDTQVTTTATSPSSEATWYLTGTTTSSTKTNDKLVKHTGLRASMLNGTTSTVGKAQITLGNSTASGTANNMIGNIALYSKSTSYHLISPADTTSAITHTLPAVTGTLINSGNCTSYQSKNGVFYVTGNTTGTEGTWTGSNTDIPSLYTGLTIAYQVGIAGVSGGTTLNLTTKAGASGAKNIYMNVDTKVTTHYGVGSVIHLTYDGTAWRRSDYNANNSVTQTVRTTNGSFPVLLRGASAGTTTTTTSTSFATTITANPSTGTLTASIVKGAVWNDYAEYRESDITEPGRVICENGDDTLSLAIERLQPGANVVSDTFGFAIGETETAKTPIAVSGRVLVYPYEDRATYKPGDAVCAAPGGTVSKMTREEIREYPERIIGTVSAIPNYETWGEGNVPVNGRIWIKVK